MQPVIKIPAPTLIHSHQKVEKHRQADAAHHADSREEAVSGR